MDIQTILIFTSLHYQVVLVLKISQRKMYGNSGEVQVRKKFDIATVNSVYTWIGKYVTQEKALSLEEQSEEDMARKSKDEQIRELQAQLKQARKEAELEKLRAKAYDTMINVAEETFNIPIRKKSGTKR